MTVDHFTESGWEAERDADLFERVEAEARRDRECDRVHWDYPPDPTEYLDPR